VVIDTEIILLLKSKKLNSILITMMLIGWILQILINGLAVYAAAYVLSGVNLDTFTTAIVVSIFIGLVNTFIKPILMLLAFPLTLITFGLFALIINAALILLVSAVVPGFTINGILWALLFSILLSITNTFLQKLV